MFEVDVNNDFGLVKVECEGIFSGKKCKNESLKITDLLEEARKNVEYYIYRISMQTKSNKSYTANKIT